jgi:hypothetical protein
MLQVFKITVVTLNSNKTKDNEVLNFQIKLVVDFILKCRQYFQTT